MSSAVLQAPQGLAFNLSRGHAIAQSMDTAFQMEDERAKGKILAMDSDCCTSNNYPPKQPD